MIKSETTKFSFRNYRQRSRCHVGTFLYVKRAVTSNMMMAHCPWILQVIETFRKTQYETGTSIFHLKKKPKNEFPMPLQL